MRITRALLVLGAAACSNSTSSGSLPPGATLTGRWLYSIGTLTSVGGAVTCAVSGISLNLVQAGSNLSGTYSGGTINCGGLLPPGSGSVANGSVSGSAVNFDFDSPNWHSTGQATSASSMTGNATVQLTVSGNSYLMSGTWLASHQ
ncbi:MAG TPA: hypothetical protein VLT79_00045 [Gemmatimonadales bacterium]|nr:hypothetical protein [Gemmatimonadales bacterium]